MPSPISNARMDSDQEVANPDRRHVLQAMGAGAALAMTGCSTASPSRPIGDCPDPDFSRPLIVDMHCHIMNLQDADRADFAKRHVLNIDEGPFTFLGDIVDALERLLAWPALLFTEQARVERALFRYDFAGMMESYQSFCETAAGNQGGFVFAQVDRQVTGFFSNRTRNAARMMELYPEVDLFTPSIVDFNEGDQDEYSSIMEQAMLYSAIAVATRGRFLPLISFHPGRSYTPDTEIGDREFNFRLQLKIVEFAIKRLGFVGVKVHPSTGFAPVRNLDYGCPNTPRQEEGGRPTEAEADRFDEAMMALYGLCRHLDVPILTHNGKGIPANKKCMMERNTNAPSQWLEAVQKANDLVTDYDGRSIPGRNKLRVCLAHFADGFDKDDYEPTDWLREAARAIETEDSIYLDVSELSEWFEEDKHESYRDAVRRFVGEHETVASRMMYGSDWHMPDTAKIGNRYLSDMQEMLEEAMGPSANVAQTMGGNAAEFFKLKKRQSNRVRLDDFLEEHGIAFERVSWRRKADRDFPRPTSDPQTDPALTSDSLSGDPASTFHSRTRAHQARHDGPVISTADIWG